MATKATAEVTVTDQTDATAIRAWYHAQTSAVAPSAPTTTDATATPSGWTLAEPTVSSASDLSKYVYRCEQLVWGDGTCDWGTVTLSASYEAAKIAYNEAQSAKTTATRYINELVDGIMVHPYGDITTGWSIRDALELLREGLSYFKVWLDDSVNKVKVRVGLETAGHTIFSPDGMEVFSDSTTSVAELGASGARIGKSDGNHVTIDDDSIDMSHSGVEMAHFGYGDGAASSGTGTAPYYTLGVRRSTTAEYDPSSTYAVGDHVVRNGTEYVCTVAIPTAEPWSAGHWTSAIGNYSAVDGFNATAGGYCSHAEGYETTAGGPYSHAEGRNTAATGSNASHAEGRETMASGTTSHAEGYNVTASGIYSHAEGASTTASNYATHAEGGLCEASGSAAHAEGYETTASGNYSHAQNAGTVAASSCQTAIGKYNDNQSSHAFEVGNGTSDSNRSNAFAVDWDGIPYHNNPAGTFGSLFDLVYPVGAIYMSTSSTSPATLFGGTWERITGRFLLAATDGGASGGNSNASIAAGNTGGEASHTLTSGESGVPAHGHGHTNPSVTMPDHSHATTNGTGQRVVAYNYGTVNKGTGKVRVAEASSGSSYVPRVSDANVDYSGYTNTGGSGTKACTVTGGSVSNNTAANASSAHNNMPPYLAVYVWKRTA